MDTILTISESFNDLVEKVKSNEIEDEYKQILKYESLVEETKNEKKNKKIDSLPIQLRVFDKASRRR